MFRARKIERWTLRIVPFPSRSNYAIKAAGDRYVWLLHIGWGREWEITYKSICLILSSLILSENFFGNCLLNILIKNDTIMLVNPTLFLLVFMVYVIISNAEITEIVDESCETLQSEVRINKDEYDETGHLRRTCSGDILVTKCEGFCNSQVQPSVVTTTGFSKVCDISHKERRIRYIAFKL